MESSLQARLFPGLSINIQRSFGIIHNASVRTVNLEKSCVSVEWTEGGATKGKEIDFDDVAAINPELLQILPLHPKDNLPLQENVTVQKQKRRSVNSKIPVPRGGLRSRSTRMSTLAEVRMPTQENDMEVELPAPTNSRKQFAASAGPPRPSCSAVAEIPLAMVSEEVEEQVHPSRGSSANPVNSGIIHNASVRTVNLEKSCVSVEWTEGGATKGKEIDFDDVAAINPELLQILPLHPKDNLPLQENVTVQKQKRRSVNSKIPVPRGGLRSRSTRMSTLAEVRMPTQENDMEVELPAPTNSRKQFAASAGPPRPSCSAVAEIPLAMVSEEVEEQVHPSRGSSANPVNSGIIHNASVRTVNLEKSCVSVEWTEGGATKGKEIDFDDVATINPELLQILPLHPKDNLPLQENVTVQKQKRRSVNSKIPVPRGGLRSRSTRMSTLAEVRMPTQENDMEVELPAPTNSRKQFAASAGPPRPSCSAVAEIPLAMVSEEVEEQVHPSRGSSANPVNSVRRKSCVVKEIEKMKNKREEKKAHNSEMRIKRAQEYDSSFPNWEFARLIKEFQTTLECHPLTVTDPIEEHRICVCVRKRPLNKQELSKKEIDVISIPSKCLLLVHEPRLKVDLTKYLENQAFCFDFVFDEMASNEVVYRFTARPLVQTIFEGGKATCFAYGQTGSGKTHTMGGDLAGKAQNASKGIYAMASRDVFLLKNQPRYRSLGLEVYVTFFEIYNGKLFDLLNKKAKLRVLDDGKQQVQVVGLQEHLVNSADDVIKKIDMGSACRTSGQTFANSNSSRSHACFQILLRTKGRVYGKFSLVDLAGNERGADTSSADRQTRMEGAEINKSLLALKECIRALGQNKAHIPFRESKLTQVLRDSFIGENSRTCMIAMISPGISSCDYTLNTLRYADRVKELSPHTGPSGELTTQMKTEETETSSIGVLMTSNFSKEEEELSSQMTSFNEAMTQIRELEEGAMEMLKEIIQVLPVLQQGPSWHELFEMTEQPDYDLENFVNKAESTLAQQAKHISSLQEIIKSLRVAMQLEEQASRQMSCKKRHQ